MIGTQVDVFQQGRGRGRTARSSKSSNFARTERVRRVGLPRRDEGAFFVGMRIGTCGSLLGKKVTGIDRPKPCAWCGRTADGAGGQARRYQLVSTGSESKLRLRVFALCPGPGCVLLDSYSVSAVGTGLQTHHFVWLENGNIEQCPKIDKGEKVDIKARTTDVGGGD